MYVWYMYMSCVWFYSFYGCRDYHDATPKDRLDERGQAYQELVNLLDNCHPQHTNVSMHIFTSAMYMYMAQIAFSAVFPGSIRTVGIACTHCMGILCCRAYDRVLVVFSEFPLISPTTHCCHLSLCITCSVS